MTFLLKMLAWHWRKKFCAFFRNCSSLWQCWSHSTAKICAILDCLPLCVPDAQFVDARERFINKISNFYFHKLFLFLISWQIRFPSTLSMASNPPIVSHLAEDLILFKARYHCSHPGLASPSPWIICDAYTLLWDVDGTMLRPFSLHSLFILFVLIL